MWQGATKRKHLSITSDRRDEMSDRKWVQICWVHRAFPCVMSLWGHVVTVQSSGSSPPTSTPDKQTRILQPTGVNGRDWRSWVTPPPMTAYKRRAFTWYRALNTSSITQTQQTGFRADLFSPLWLYSYYLQTGDGPLLMQLKRLIINVRLVVQSPSTSWESARWMKAST